MGTKNVLFTVRLEIDKDDYYGMLQDTDNPLTPAEFLAMLATNMAEPNYSREVFFDGLVD